MVNLLETSEVCETKAGAAGAVEVFLTHSDSSSCPRHNSSVTGRRAVAKGQEHFEGCPCRMLTWPQTPPTAWTRAQTLAASLTPGAHEPSRQDDSCREGGIAPDFLLSIDVLSNERSCNDLELMFPEREPGFEGGIDLGLYPAAKALIMLRDLPVLFTSGKRRPE